MCCMVCTRASNCYRLNLKYIILCANHNLMNLEILPVKNSICTDTCLCKCGDTCAWLPGRYGAGLIAAKVIGQVPVLLFVSWVHCDLPKECQAQEVLTESWVLLWSNLGFVDWLGLSSGNHLGEKQFSHILWEKKKNEYLCTFQDAPISWLQSCCLGKMAS